MFKTAPQITMEEIALRAQNSSGWPWMRCVRFPNTRIAMSTTAPAMMALAPAFAIVRGFISENFGS